VIHDFNEKEAVKWIRNRSLTRKEVYSLDTKTGMLIVRKVNQKTIKQIKGNMTWIKKHKNGKHIAWCGAKPDRYTKIKPLKLNKCYSQGLCYDDYMDITSGKHHNW